MATVVIGGLITTTLLTLLVLPLLYPMFERKHAGREPQPTEAAETEFAVV